MEKQAVAGNYGFKTSTKRINFAALWFNFSPFHLANHIQFPKVIEDPSDGLAISKSSINFQWD